MRGSPGLRAAIAAALLGTLAIAGCSSSPSTSTSPNSSPSGSGSAAMSSVTLNVEGWKGGGAEPANVSKVNAAFEKAYPNIKLDYTYVPPNNVYLEKVQSQLLAGSASDVIMVDPQKVQSWGSQGYLADQSQQPWAASIGSNLKPFVSLNGKIYASPMELSPVGLYVNMDVLAKAGITQPPTDFPTFLSDLAKLKAKNLPGFSFPDAQGYMAEFIMMMSAATTVYQQNPQWDEQFLTHKVSFQPGFSTPLTQIQQLGTDGYVNLKDSVGVDETTTGEPDFIGGKSAFYGGGSWLAQAIQKADFKLAFIPWPGGSAGTAPSALLYPGTMWSVNAATKVSAAAEDYVKFWSQSQNLSPYLQSEAAISPFGGPAGGSAPILSTMAATYGTGKFTIMPINSWLLADPETKIRSDLQGFLLGKSSVPATLRHPERRFLHFFLTATAAAGPAGWPDRPSSRRSGQARASARSGRDTSDVLRRRKLALLSMALPALTLYGVIIGYPLVRGILLSFTDNMGGPISHWVGLAQYRTLIHDDEVLQALKHTLIYALVVVVLQNALGLAAAYVLQRRVRVRRAVSSILLLPALMSPVMASFIWSYLYRPDGGIDALLGQIGLASLAQVWLGNPTIALYAIAVVNIWMFAGYSCIIFLAGYAGMPRELLDAASIDGANGWRRFRSIEWPLLAPALTVTVTLSLIGSLSVFDFPLVLTNGGPVGSTNTLALQIYDDIFNNSQFGYGAATSALLLVLVVAASGIASIVLRRREQWL